MGRVLTNATTIAYAREAALGILPGEQGQPGTPEWKTLEPDSIGSFGASFTKVSRDPISKRRSRRRGTIVDVDAATEYDGDITIDSFVDFIEAFLFSVAVNADLTFRAPPATGTGYTIPAATQDQADKIQFNAGGPITLLHAAGYVNGANNSPQTVKPIEADLVLSGTELTVSGLVVETPPSNAEVSVGGIRATAGDLAFAVSGVIGTLTSGNNLVTGAAQLDFTTLGWTVGQRIHIGGLTDANRFGSTAAADGTRSFGGARLRTISADTCTFDKLDTLLVPSDGSDDGNGGTLIPVDLLFGRFIRDVPVDHADHLEQPLQFEGAYSNLFETDPPTPVANPDGFEYVKGSFANLLTWNLALTDKATATFAFVAIDADDPVDNASRKTNADTPREPLFTGALNTSTDFARLGLTELDEDGLTTDFKDMTVTIDNQVTPEKVLGRRGAKFLNIGNLLVGVSSEVLFTSPLVTAAISANTPVTLGWLVRNDDGAIDTDLPSGTLGSEGKNFEENASVRQALTFEADSDNVFGYQIAVSLFPVYPADENNVI